MTVPKKITTTKFMVYIRWAWVSLPMNPHMWDLIISSLILIFYSSANLHRYFREWNHQWIYMQVHVTKTARWTKVLTGTLMQFRNWKRLLRSSVDHYGKYRFARLRIVSLRDFKSSDPYETGPTNPSWSEVRHMYVLCPFSSLSLCCGCKTTQFVL